MHSIHVLNNVLVSDSVKADSDDVVAALTEQNGPVAAGREGFVKPRQMLIRVSYTGQVFVSLCMYICVCVVSD